MAKTAVKKLVIELNGKDVELTMAQARELHAALNELFEERVREVSYPIYRRPYVWPWAKPYWLCQSGTRATLNDNSMHLALKS
mgnify:CR=1 FL=1